MTLLTKSTIKFGQRVKCINNPDPYTIGKIGTIVEIKRAPINQTSAIYTLSNSLEYFKVDIGSIGRIEDVDPEHFELIQDVIPFSSFEEIHQGMRVQCVYHTIPTAYNQLAIVVASSPSSLLEVHWDNGSHMHIAWSMASSFAPLTLSDEKVVVVSASSKVPEAPCKVCCRMNDIGISKCWNCETPRPC